MRVRCQCSWQQQDFESLPASAIEYQAISTLRGLVSAQVEENAYEGLLGCSSSLLGRESEVITGGRKDRILYPVLVTKYLLEGKVCFR